MKLLDYFFALISRELSFLVRFLLESVIIFARCSIIVIRLKHESRIKVNTVFLRLRRFCCRKLTLSWKTPGFEIDFKYGGAVRPLVSAWVSFHHRCQCHVKFKSKATSFFSRLFLNVFSQRWVLIAALLLTSVFLQSRKFYQVLFWYVLANPMYCLNYCFSLIN